MPPSADVWFLTVCGRATKLNSLQYRKSVLSITLVAYFTPLMTAVVSCYCSQLESFKNMANLQFSPGSHYSNRVQAL